MKIGIVGLPNVGKSTLFNAITNGSAASSNYPFCTIEPNTGIGLLKDKRIDELAKLSNSKKIIYPIVEFIDIAGLVKGASKGEGLGNKFLSHIREVDAIAHVVRAFNDENITHVSSKPIPKDDIEVINIELILSDLESVNKNIQRVEKALKSDKSLKESDEVLHELKSHLESGNPVRTIMDGFSDEKKEYIKTLNLLSSKKVIYIANVKEDEILNDENELFMQIKEIAEEENSEVIKIAGKLEEETNSLGDEEKELYLKELGVEKTGLDKLIKASYDILGLITYFTSGEKETRGWTIKNSDKAPKAAGKIHTDFEKGFIRAEVISYDELIKQGSLKTAKENGKVRVEGKDYIVKDGDVMTFLFNV